MAGLLAGCSPSGEPAKQTEQGESPAPSPAPNAASAPNAAAAAVATAKMGEMLFRRCIACHTVERGGPHGIGPNLHDVIGRPPAALPDFAYSNAMKAEGGLWDEAALDAFLEQPMKAIPGNRMVFAGIIEPADRKAVYLYLKENSR